MDWSNERYVRLYVRDTVTWKLLPWQSQLLIPAIMRKLDRGGRLDLDGETVADAVQAVLEKVPAEIISIGLEAALQRSVFRIERNVLVMPNFPPAQAAQPSIAQRKREERDRKKAEGLVRVRANGRDSWVNWAGQRVTKEDPGSQDVSGVDPGHSSLAEPSLAEPLNTLPAKKASRAGKPVDPRISPLKEKLVAAFEQKTGKKYGWHRADAKALVELVRHPEAEVLERWNRGLTATEFRKRCANIWELVAKWNELAMANGAVPAGHSLPKRIGAEDIRDEEYGPIGEIR